MSPEDVAERLAVLETEMLAVKEDAHAMKADVHAILKSQSEMMNELTRYRGIWGGVLLVFSAVGVFLQFFIPAIKQWLGKE